MIEAEAGPAAPVRPLLAALLGSLLAVLLVRGVWRAGGLLVLTGVVALTVVTLAVGLLVLRVALG